MIQKAKKVCFGGCSGWRIENYAMQLYISDGMPPFSPVAEADHFLPTMCNRDCHDK
jgi:hypothetical protein